jgi:hypothetical protein
MRSTLTPKELALDSAFEGFNNHVVEHGCAVRCCAQRLALYLRFLELYTTTVTTDDDLPTSCSGRRCSVSV